MTEPAVATADTPAPSTPIVARAGRYYRNARYIMVVGLLVMGGYFAYDGYKGWPERNRKIEEVDKALNTVPKDSPDWPKLEKVQRDLGEKKTDTDIALQKVLGYLLPLAALGYLAFFLNKSRGEIRLEGGTLIVPGHPPVPLSSVTSVDESLWKKKGIATVKYEVDGRKGEIRLDDFVYQQTPIDAIYDRVLARTRPSDPASTADEPI